MVDENLKDELILIRNKVNGLLEKLADWTTKFVNNLPDNSFAVLAPGGKKDDEGKTVPRTLRFLPHHGMNVKSGNEDDTVDIPHLRNALARVSQISYKAGISKAEAHLEKHAKALEIGGRKKMAEEYKCSCIKCGYEQTYSDHCNLQTCPKCGGQMRRIERPGPGQPTQQENMELKALMEKADIKEETIKKYFEK